jgi:hypothetical protein
MWTVLIWILFLTLVAWVFYNAVENIRHERGMEHKRSRRNDAGLRKYSPGETVIANWLTRRAVPYEFDKPVAHSLREPPLRPDFVIPEKRLFIDYYGVNSADASIRDRKESHYRASGWQVVSLTRPDIDRLDDILGPALGLASAEPA